MKSKINPGYLATNLLTQAGTRLQVGRLGHSSGEHRGVVEIVKLVAGVRQPALRTLQLHLIGGDLAFQFPHTIIKRGGGGGQGDKRVDQRFNFSLRPGDGQL
jgi:hypothetical protein